MCGTRRPTGRSHSRTCGRRQRRVPLALGRHCAVSLNPGSDLLALVHLVQTERRSNDTRRDELLWLDRWLLGSLLARRFGNLLSAPREVLSTQGLKRLVLAVGVGEAPKTPHVAAPVRDRPAAQHERLRGPPQRPEPLTVDRHGTVGFDTSIELLALVLRVQVEWGLNNARVDEPLQRDNFGVSGAWADYRACRESRAPGELQARCGTPLESRTAPGPGAGLQRHPWR